MIQRTKLCRIPSIRLSHLLLAILALAIGGMGAPTPISIPLGPPQQVITSNPLVGIHTRLTDEVETWKIQRTFQMVREMGAPWVVEFFPWPYIEPKAGKFDWSHSDTVVNQAVNQGITLIARLGWTPDWARPEPEVKETTHTYLDAEHYPDFAAFAAQFVAHYQGKVRYIIVWNEPNLSFEWGYRPVDPVEYVALLREVYPAVRAANPDITVLAGALAPTLEPIGSPAGLSDLLYLEQMYAAGASDYFDALAVHAYGLTFPPEEPPSPDVIDFRRVELLREVMERYGDTHKPIYVTESGWNDHPRWVNGVRPAQRIAYTIGAYEWARQHWSWCSCVAMWTFRYPASTLSYHDYYSFVTVDFEPKVIYWEVQAYTQGE